MLSIFVTCPPYLEDLLEEEATALGARDVQRQPAGIRAQANLATIYRLCVGSRLANGVLLELSAFPIATSDDIYDGARRLPWLEHFTRARTLAVDVTGKSPLFRDTRLAALKVKDAVVDELRDKTGRRPDVDRHDPDVRLHVHLTATSAIISINLSGPSLHRRGYRAQQGAAPLKENVAAAILLRSNWPALAQKDLPLVDPMCGSGTLVLEAALMAADIAPGLLRRGFGFEGWAGHDPRLWETVWREAGERARAGVSNIAPDQLQGFDHDRQAIEAARVNAQEAGVEDLVRFSVRELGRVQAPRPEGLLVSNPPYGERLGNPSALRPLYAQLGQHLQSDFAGWHAGIILSDPDLGHAMGVRASRTNRMMNGPIDCALLRFEPGPARGRPEISVEDHPLANRLRKNQKRLRKWREREDITCYRVYDADIPEFAFAIDVYHDHVHVQEYEAGADIDPQQASRRRREALAILPEVMGVPADKVHFKRRRRQKGTQQYERLGQGGNRFVVREGGLQFWVNLTDYLDTGLFLDHRITRGMIRDMAKGKRFLNLFAYTGSVSVYAAAGGARTTSVDLSNTYSAWCEDNLRLNRLAGRQHRVVRRDVWSFLEEDRARYDLIFLDPPTFSNSKAMASSFDLQRDQVPLLRATLARLAPGGVLIFSNNYRRFRLNEDALSGWRCQDITQQTIPPDFARGRPIHQCWKITAEDNA